MDWYIFLLHHPITFVNFSSLGVAWIIYVKGTSFTRKFIRGKNKDYRNLEHKRLVNRSLFVFEKQTLLAFFLISKL